MTWIAACSGQRGSYQEVVMIDEAGLQYLRNINTKPGSNAGRSIDPTKPGPDDSDGRQNFRKAALEYLRDPDAVTDPKVQARIADEIERLVAEAQSDAKRIIELEAECGRFENELFEARERLRYFDEQAIRFQGRAQ